MPRAMQQKESDVGGRAFRSPLLFLSLIVKKGSGMYLSNIIVSYLNSFYPVLSYSVPDSLGPSAAHAHGRSDGQQARKACNGERLWVVMQPKYGAASAPNVII